MYLLAVEEIVTPEKNGERIVELRCRDLFSKIKKLGRVR